MDKAESVLRIACQRRELLRGGVNPLSVTMSTNKFITATFTGPAGSALVVLGSGDLTTWTPITTNTPFTGTFLFEDPATSAHTLRNYRARLDP